MTEPEPIEIVLHTDDLIRDPEGGWIWPERETHPWPEWRSEEDTYE